MAKIFLIIGIIVLIALLVYGFYPKPMGSIELKTPTVQSKLGIQSPWRTHWIFSDQDPVILRARQYQPDVIELTAQKGGVTWKLIGKGPWGSLSPISVQPDRTTLLEPGPPLKIKTKLHSRQRVVSVEYAIVGRAGEQYQSVIRNGKRGDLPKVEIVDRSGKILDSGKFEYG